MSDYHDFATEMDSLNKDFGKEKKIDELIQLLKESVENVHRLTDIAKLEHERVNDLYHSLYLMFPESDVIETIAEDDAEAKEIYKRYIGTNENY